MSRLPVWKRCRLSAPLCDGGGEAPFFVEWVIATPREWELSAEAGEPGWEVSALGPRVLAIRALDRVTRQVVPFRAVGDPSPWLGF